MGKRDYPFNKSDIKFGTNLIASLLAIPIASLFSGASIGNTDSWDWGPVKFNNAKFMIGNIFRGFIAIICPIIGVLAFLFYDYWLFFSILIFGYLEFIFFWCRILDIREILTNKYVFDKDNLDAQMKCVRKNIVLNNWLSIILIILNTYPLILAILYWVDAELWSAVEIGYIYTFSDFIPEWEPNVIVFILWGLFWLFRCIITLATVTEKTIVEDSLSRNESIISKVCSQK